MHQLGSARPSTGLVSHSHRSGKSRGSRGFTLVELLVVIGIIALLISILLPTLASARRSANSVKCLASLKEIGNAFNLYAIENKGFYPATRDTQIKSSTGAALDRRWTDYIARYMNKKAASFTGSQDVGQIRKSSVLWGCPEWLRAFEYDPSLPSWNSQNVYTGYGMNWYPGYPDQHKNENNAFRNAPAKRGYIKQSMYGRNGAERLLVADSTYDFLQLPTSGYTANVKFAPFDVLNPAAPADDFFVDARHMKAGTPKPGAKGQTPINALFADGHAAAVSPRGAYDAIRTPGAGSIVAAGVK